MIRILLVDDQNLVQQGIKSLLDQNPVFKVIGTVKDGRSAIKQVDLLRPDIVLLDIEMPGMDGITATKYISRLSPQTKVIILSSHEDKKYLTQALMAGAKAYLLKSSLLKDLKQAIIAVEGGYSHIESRLLAKIFDPSNLKLRSSKSASTTTKNEDNSKLHHISVKQTSQIEPVNAASTFNHQALDQLDSQPQNIVFQSHDIQKQAHGVDVDAPSDSMEQLHLQESAQITSDLEAPQIISPSLPSPDDQEHASYEEIASRLNLRHIQLNSNSELRNNKSNSSLTNQFLAAKIIHLSTNQWSRSPKGNSNKFSQPFFRFRNYLKQVIEQARYVKYKIKFTHLCHSILLQCQAIIRLAKTNLSKFNWSPTIKDWYEKGLVTNVGLMLLGLIIVLIIY